MPVVLLSLDTRTGVFRRYRRGANNRPIFEQSIKIEPWEPVSLGVVALDRNAIERFRLESTAFQETPLEAA